MSPLNSFRCLQVLLVLSSCRVLAKDEVSGYGQVEPALAGRLYPVGLTENALRDLPLADPELRAAYYFFIISATSSGPVADARNPEMLEVLKDVRRRGDSATPLWLDLMEKNHNTSLEYLIP